MEPLRNDGSRPRIRSIRLDEPDIQAVLDVLDRSSEAARTQETPPRYRYRIPSLHLDLWVPGAPTSSSYAVPSRWLSQTGLCCLHGMFVHQGTVARVNLITLYGTWDEVDGWVQQCRYISGHVHELELRFVHRIDPSLYCAEAVACRVLLVEDDQLTARMIGAWLNQLNAAVEHVVDGQEAVERVAQKTYDLVLMDLDLPVMDGFKAARTLRNGGYCGRIAAISAMSTPKIQSMCIQCGCDLFLAKPFCRDDLADLLASLREEPIFSTLPYADSVGELISDFVKELPLQVRKLQDAVAGGDVKASQTAVRMLKSQGSTYGFDCVTTAAAAIEAALNQGISSPELRQRVQELRRICSRIRPTVRSSRPT